MSERERKRLHNQFILVHSTPKLHSAPRTTTGYSTSNQSHITNTQNQRGDLDHTRTLTLFAFHTTTVRIPSDLTG